MIGEQSYKSGMSNIQPNDELTMGGSRLNEGLMSMQLMYIGGIIDSSQIAGMRRLIIRATRCQAYVRSFEVNINLNDQLCGDDYDQKKNLYVIVCQQSPMMEEKIRRICASFPG